MQDFIDTVPYKALTKQQEADKQMANFLSYQAKLMETKGKQKLFASGLAIVVTACLASLGLLAKDSTLLLMCLSFAGYVMGTMDNAKAAKLMAESNVFWDKVLKAHYDA